MSKVKYVVTWHENGLRCQKTYDTEVHQVWWTRVIRHLSGVTDVKRFILTD